MNQVKNLTPPEPPAEWECCNGGCNEACLWQIYYREKAAYEAALANETS